MKKYLFLILFVFVSVVAVFAEETVEKDLDSVLKDFTHITTEKIISFCDLNKTDSNENVEENVFHWLIGLDLKGGIYSCSYWKYTNEVTNYLYFGLEALLLDFECQLPTHSNFSMYFGLRAFSVLMYNQVELITRFGYRFDKPDTWKKYHFELLGNVGGGIVFGGLLSGWIVSPFAKTGVQLYLLPQTKGFYIGFGPNVLVENMYNGNEMSIDVELSIGYKF